MKKLIKFILTLILLVISISLIYGYSLMQVEFVGIDNVNMTNMSFSGFTLTGDLVLYNNGYLPVHVTKITYDLQILNESLGSGVIKGGWIGPKENTKYKLNYTSLWIPTAKLAMDLIKNEGTNLTIEGNITVVENYIVVPYKTKVDIKTYIWQFASEKFDSIVDNAGKWGKDLLNVIDNLELIN